MKKTTLLFLFLFFFGLTLHAQQNNLSPYLPLFQANYRTAAQTQQVLQLFYSSTDPNTVFSAGASLVRIPPSQNQQAKLLNLVMKGNTSLKTIFAAIILTAMGNVYEELTPLLEQAVSSPDHALRAYAASAYTLLNPQNKQYAPYIINLYIYDPAFAQRAMNMLADTEQDTFKYLKEASVSTDGYVRAAAATWLGDLQTQQAAKQLLKMAKREVVNQVSTSLAVALAKNRTWTQADVVKELKTPPTNPQATTYALALGFMTGYAVDSIKQSLLSTKENTRANAARAAAYMAGVLSSPQAAIYTQDKAFDIELLKSLLPLLNTMSHQDSLTVKPYAEHAVQQIRHLK